MTDLSLQVPPSTQFTPKILSSFVLLLIVISIVFWLTSYFFQLTTEDELLRGSTVGELAIWMSEQTERSNLEAILGRLAKNWADSIGEESLPPDVALNTMRNGLVLWTGVIGVLAIIGLISLFLKPIQARHWLLAALLGLDVLIFIIPVIEGNRILAVLLGSIVIMLVVLLLAPGKVSRVLGFFVVLSTLFVVWETSKAFAATVNYRILFPQPAWEYTTYPTLDAALVALETGETDAVVFDRRDLSEVVPSRTATSIDETLVYKDLRYLDNLEYKDGTGFFAIRPEFPGRLSIAVRAENSEQWETLSQFMDVSVATVVSEFADTNYLSQPRSLLLVDLKILNDINLPHLQTIAEAFMQPARRNGSQLLIRILAEAAQYTWGEAALGFAFGAILGFILGTAFAHSALMERSLLPYVVASQTIPILAIAPMVVIWLGASQISVSVIAAYLTFFPVTINTLRGLQSPSQIEVDLMESYAANRWTILWKLRVPAALPYIFTALKVSATASVVGAIIGELPSGIGNGLGRAILNFSSDYSLISTPKLWASIIMAASIGVFFFVAVSIVERLILGRYIRNL